MLTVEESITQLEPYTRASHPLVIKQKWDRDFINSIYHQVSAGRGLSYKQGEVAVKLIKTHRRLLEIAGCIPLEIDYLILNPTYKIKPYESITILKEVRWVKDNILVFRFSYNQKLIDEFQTLSKASCFFEHSIIYDRNHRVNIIFVNENNIEQIMKIIKDYRISFDNEVAQFFVNAMNAIDKKTTFSINNDKIRIEINNDEFIQEWFDYILSMEE